MRHTPAQRVPTPSTDDAIEVEAYLAQDKFEWVDKLVPSPEVVYGQFHGCGATKSDVAGLYVEKIGSISIVLTRNFCSATVAHPWRKKLRHCARLVSFMQNISI